MEHIHSHSKQALRDAGYKLTRPRLTILDIVEEAGGHLTSTALLELVEARDPSIGRASVFRTLDLLVQIGIIASTVQGGSTINYVLMPEGHHHHMVCTRCQRLIEFQDCRLGALLSTLETDYGFHPDGHLLEVYGICADCQRKAPIPAD
jgi:Fur family ferric uptake transcriptional regulator